MPELFAGPTPPASKLHTLVCEAVRHAKENPGAQVLFVGATDEKLSKAWAAMPLRREDVKDWTWRDQQRRVPDAVHFYNGSSITFARLDQAPGKVSTPPALSIVWEEVT